MYVCVYMSVCIYPREALCKDTKFVKIQTLGLDIIAS
jgi:hypothetical protein